jgi:hypothetical protein
MDRRFFRVVLVRSHAEGAAWDPDHVRRRRLVPPVNRSSNPIVHARLTLLVLGKDERQNSCDDRSGDGALNLIQIKDVSFKNACPIVGTTTPKVKPIGRRKELPS